jgi:hypothetical protein
MENKQAITKDQLDDEIFARFGFHAGKYSAYGIASWKKNTLLALLKIFSTYNIRIVSIPSQCCLTKSQMAFQLQQYYGRFGLVFTPHEINYISRDGFILLYNALIEGRQGK